MASSQVDSRSPLRNRLLDIEAELRRLDARAADLRAESDEIKSAIRVLDRYVGAETLVTAPSMPAVNAATPAQEKRKSTLPDAILEIVQANSLFGGADAKAIIRALNQGYDVNTDPNSVRPTLWRMVQSGRLGRQGELYTLPKENEAPAE